MRAAAARYQVLSPTGTESVTTQLPVLINGLVSGFGEARTVERIGAVQLAVLALIAFAVVVSGAAAQRGSEIALARLRGRSAATAGRQFVAEVAVLLALAVVPALVVAWLLTLRGCPHLLPGRDGRARPCPWWATPWRALVAALATTVVIGWRVTRQPVNDQLRELPPRGRGIGLVVVDVAVATAAAAGLLLLVTGTTAGGLTLLTPLLLAALAGLLLGRSAVGVGRAVAVWAWRRGRVALGLAAASVARRRGYRLATAALTICAALVVFAGQQDAVARQNREARALAENGAAVVLDVTPPDVSSLLDALHAGDPSGSYATAVVEPSTVSQTPVIAVDAPSFVRVASWGWPSSRPAAATLAAFTQHVAAPAIPVRTGMLTVHLRDLRVHQLGTSTGGGSGLLAHLGPVFLQLAFRKLGVGGIATASFGPLPATAAALDLTAPVDCAGGCLLRSMNIERDTLDANQAAISAVIDGVTTGTGGRARPARPRRRLGQHDTPRHRLVDAEGVTRFQLTDDGPALRLNAVDADGVASAQYLDLPVGAPALYAGSISASTDSLGYQVEPGLDGSDFRVRAVGTIAFVPRIGPKAILVDLAAAAATRAGPAVRVADLAGHRRLAARGGDAGRARGASHRRHRSVPRRRHPRRIRPGRPRHRSRPHRRRGPAGRAHRRRAVAAHRRVVVARAVPDNAGLRLAGVRGPHAAPRLGVRAANGGPGQYGRRGLGRDRGSAPGAARPAAVHRAAGRAGAPAHVRGLAVVRRARRGGGRCCSP